MRDLHCLLGLVLSDLQSVFKLNGNCNQWHRRVAEAPLVQEILPKGGVIDSFATSHFLKIIIIIITLINHHHHHQYDRRLLEKSSTSESRDQKHEFKNHPELKI